jgi:Nitroreductase
MSYVDKRKSKYPISEIFLDRRSQRAMSQEPITNEELMTLFEAARFAPSAYNDQPWRFVYARKGTKLWQDMLSLMSPFNQSWAKDATVFVVLISKKRFDFNGNLSHTNSFDAGAAWMSLALQGSISGLVVHAIADFDYNKVEEILNLPAEFKIEIIIALGKPGNKEQLPVGLQERESFSDRKPLEEIVFEDKFK